METNFNSSILFVISLIFITFILNQMTKKKTLNLIQKCNLKENSTQKINSNNDFKVLVPRNNDSRLIEVETNNKNSKQTFVSLVTYNILSQRFADAQLKGKFLSVEMRIGAILNELKELNSDIICLQEVNLDVIEKFLLKYFITNGYYFMYGKNEGSQFNNLIAYKNRKFHYVSQKNFQLSFNEHNQFFIGNRGVFRLELKMTNNNKTIIIYNVHFPWRPHLEFHKSMILSYIFEDIYKYYYYSSCHVFISGDFNSIPDSLVVKLLYFDLEKKFFEENFHKIKDNLPTLCLDTKNHKFLFQIIRGEKEKKCYERILKIIESVNKNFKFRSAFENYKILSNSNKAIPIYNYVENHPDFTNYNRKFHGNIDYIFYSNNIFLKKILSLPSILEIKRESILPNERFPSDHIKIYAEFVI